MVLIKFFGDISSFFVKKFFVSRLFGEKILFMEMRFFKFFFDSGVLVCVNGLIEIKLYLFL